MQRHRTAQLPLRPIVEGMGHFYVKLEVSAIANRAERHSRRAMVDTGSEYSWIPAEDLESLGVERELSIEFTTADGHRLTRDAGYAFLWVGLWQTVDIVVFAEPSDATLLGARTLEGMNVNVDPLGKRLVPGGPVPATGNVVVGHA
jgi:predicted aspartyl protease